MPDVFCTRGSKRTSRSTSVLLAERTPGFKSGDLFFQLVDQAFERPYRQFASVRVITLFVLVRFVTFFQQAEFFPRRFQCALTRRLMR